MTNFGFMVIFLSFASFLYLFFLCVLFALRDLSKQHITVFFVSYPKLIFLLVVLSMLDIQSVWYTIVDLLRECCYDNP